MKLEFVFWNKMKGFLPSKYLGKEHSREKHEQGGVPSGEEMLRVFGDHQGVFCGWSKGERRRLVGDEFRVEMCQVD